MFGVHEWSVLRAVVTGGAGYVGSTLVRTLADRRHSVFSIDSLRRGSYSVLKGVSSSHLIVGDIRHREELLKTLDGLGKIDAVLHLAALPGLQLCKEHPEEATAVNVDGTRNVLEAVQALGIERLVFVSSAAVYGTPHRLPVDEEHPVEPLNHYGQTKLDAEKLVKESSEIHGIEAVILRPGNVYGLGLFTRDDTVIPRFIRQALRGEALTVYGDGGSTRDYVHVQDVSESIILASQAKDVSGEVFNIGAETVRTIDIAEMVKRAVEPVTRRSVQIIHLPPRQGETEHFSYAIEKARTMLGYRPVYTVEQGIKQLIEYYLQTSP